MPSTRLGPRRRTLLYDTDLLSVKTVSLSSPLEIVFAVTASLGATGLSLNRLAVAAKNWIGVLAAGLDFQERKLALDRSRALAPLQLELDEARLRNELAAERRRRVVVPPQDNLVDQARQGTFEYRTDSEGELPSGPDDNIEDELPPRPNDAGRQPRFAGSMDTHEFAELLEDPMDRLLGYSGGEMEVAGDEEASD